MTGKADYKIGRSPSQSIPTAAPLKIVYLFDRISLLKIYFKEIGIMPEIKVNETLCKGCQLCTAACPKQCISMSETFSVTGYYPAKLAKPECCIGCGLCAQICPDLAIEVYK